MSSLLAAFAEGEKRGRKKAEIGACWDSVKATFGRDSQDARSEWVRRAADGLISQTGPAVNAAMLRVFGVASIDDLSSQSREAAYTVVARRIVFDPSNATRGPRSATPFDLRRTWRDHILAAHSAYLGVRLWLRHQDRSGHPAPHSPDRECAARGEE